MNLVIVGTGYVGLTSALGYTQLGHRVACVDVDAEKIAQLDLGHVPFFEAGLSDVLHIAQESGSIIFTTDLASVLSEAELVLFAVGTPSTSTGEANLSYLLHAARDVGRYLDHEVLLVVKSTVPVGTNQRVLEVVREAMTAAGRQDLTSLIQIASLPEFLREGSALADFMAPERIVVGAEDEVAYRMIEELHRGIQTTWVKTTIETAELTKYAANAMLATKISFINEIANIAERTGANVVDIAHAIGLDSRIGPHFLNAGIGYGGSCFPKDVSALRQIAGSIGYDFKLLSAVIEVNNHQRDIFLKKIQDVLGDLKGRRIAVWGLAFKPGTDDVRESAAIDLVRRLYALGADVLAYDPKGMETAKRVLPDGIQFAPTAIDAAEGAEALVVLTEWPEFRDVSFTTLKARMLDPIVFDGRNCLRDVRLEKFGFTYVGVGI
ncbi:MAG: UDP-glucose/GDP-mannose dehydrogenase family protein [Candidatus Uhrbacteria bacterium]|nr:UDP-glucose/GDP-mannose dehydrogenase family protein [Candidatus Uhrbacteria bacterium]